MKIQLRFFASIREALNTSEETVNLPAEVKTIGDVRHWLTARGDVWADALAEGRALRMAYDQQLTDADTLIEDGGEVAFFPPVTGG
ncbi:molybdopterin converting factor subunit 1 [Undibacterium sp. 5I1]|uniref:molybdopterin converting factor subunit 1 n=1 Tax=unclassified Undibacterium TaxID=2630295 RepID=UPI002AB4F82E|nr:MULTISPECIES: molybdopterin converting factor subunit 1 [unclassified Undibacterium]MDY7537743.1 molybdopterin converting factor subunit 1 [Undibacterium sp. 5I1]MEB0229860.1 molybdopterin converting factor subunit 1 [Undibacterium sp. 10I3]MEB0259696.1 molybdopterin converting factor subunit 1 [Undibacterium sp. 5I1]